MSLQIQFTSLPSFDGREQIETDGTLAEGYEPPPPLHRVAFQDKNHPKQKESWDNPMKMAKDWK